MAQDVGEWLEKLGLGEYAEAFATNKINFKHLPDLSEDDLAELGVSPLGDRKLLVRAITALAGDGFQQAVPDRHHARGSPAQGSDAEHRQLTVLFCDLVGSTALSQRLDPEDLRELMQHYQVTVAEVVMRFQGHVAKFLGDGVLAYFGWPRAHENQAESAVRTGLALAQAVRDLKKAVKQNLSVRVGIATGHVVIGDIVGETASERGAVAGETPILAARLMNLALPNQVVTDTATRKLVGGALKFEDLGAQQLKGFEQPVSTWQVVGEPNPDTRFKLTHSGQLTPFVGRKDEIELLWQAWQQSQENVGQVVLICGEPGIGKSRLLEALHGKLGETDCTCITLSCSPYHTNSALYPLIIHLEQLLRLRGEDEPPDKLRKLEDALRGTNLPLNDVLPLIASLLSIPLPDGKYSASSLTAQKQKHQTMDAIVAWLLDEARQRPVLLTWEDLHWADPSTLEILASQIRQSRNAPILNVLTCRPEFRPPWQSDIQITTVKLGRLKRSEAETLIRQQAKGQDLSQMAVDHIVGKTDGIPLYIEELTKVMLDSRLLSERNTGHELPHDITSATIPASLQDSLMARLDRSPKAREVAQVAAVLGREFDFQTLQAVSSFEETALRWALVQLVDAELLNQRGQHPHTRYSFKHALIRDTAYGSLLKAKRRPVHQRAAEIIETMHPEMTRKRPEIVAYHFMEAGSHEKAIEYWLKAGELAIARSANMEAIAHLKTGLKLVPAIRQPTTRIETELELQSKLAVPLTFVKGWSSPDVRQAYQRARKLCNRLGRTEDLFPILRGYWNYHLTRGEHKQALHLARRLSSVVTSASSAHQRALSCRALGTSLFFVGETAKAKEYLQSGIDIDDALSEHMRHLEVATHGDSAGVVCRLYAAWNYWLTGYPDTALKLANEGLELGQNLSFSHCVGWALCFKAVALLHCREFVVALSVSEEAIAHATEHDLAPWLAIGTMCRGRALTGLGRFDEGVELLLAGHAKWHKTGARLGDTQWLGFLAASGIETNDLDSAWSALRKANAVSDANRERFYFAELARLEGVLLAEAGDESAAEKQFKLAIRRAREQQARSLELRASTSLAALWKRQGSVTRSRELLTPVYDWFSEGFNTPDLNDAKELLDSLR